MLVTIKGNLVWWHPLKNHCQPLLHLGQQFPILPKQTSMQYIPGVCVCIYIIIYIYFFAPENWICERVFHIRQFFCTVFLVSISICLSVFLSFHKLWTAAAIWNYTYIHNICITHVVTFIRKELPSSISM